MISLRRVELTMVSSNRYSAPGEDRHHRRRAGHAHDEGTWTIARTGDPSRSILRAGLTRGFRLDLAQLLRVELQLQQARLVEADIDFVQLALD